MCHTPTGKTALRPLIRSHVRYGSIDFIITIPAVRLRKSLLKLSYDRYVHWRWVCDIFWKIYFHYFTCANRKCKYTWIELVWYFLYKNRTEYLFCKQTCYSHFLLNFIVFTGFSFDWKWKLCKNIECKSLLEENRKHSIYRIRNIYSQFFCLTFVYLQNLMLIKWSDKNWFNFLSGHQSIIINKLGHYNLFSDDHKPDSQF